MRSNRSDDQPLLILTGPTAVGKTSVSLELARRRRIAIISADSMQVYRRLDIGTAKPAPQERAAVPHYGFDLLDPDSVYSVAAWRQHALEAIAEAEDRGLTPVIVGGTRLYIHSLTSPFDPASSPDPLIRSDLEQYLQSAGIQALHNRLNEMDPESAARLPVNDVKRVMRALEVCLTTGRALSELQNASKQRSPAVRATIAALLRPREELYAITDSRTSEFLRSGWLAEVRGLLEDGFGPGLELIKAHGYRELAAHLRGELTLDEAVNTLNRNVRRLVRYQMGWIRNWSGIIPIPMDGSAAAAADRIEELLPAAAG